MKLAKALKEKNRLAGELNRLQNLFRRENSRDLKSTSTVDREQVWNSIQTVSNKLIDIKTKIFKANSAIYGKIIRMGELKAMIAYLAGVNTQDESREMALGNTIVTRVTTAWMKEEAKDQKVQDLQKEIEDLQDQIDEHNATVTIAD